MKNRKKAIQIKAVTTIIKKLQAAGLQPTFHILDNEVSTDRIAFLKTNENITVQLASAGFHRRNASEREIRTFKNRFIAGLCKAHKNFPLNKWDSLLPQAIITLNLLRTSRLNPKLSAHALLNGLYKFNATPMATPGYMIMVHRKPALCGTWAAHAVNAWYLGPTLHHYRCYHVYIVETRGECIAYTVVCFPTLNLLRTSRLNPKLSAHALLNGLYNFNATPMAPWAP